MGEGVGGVVISVGGYVVQGCIFFPKIGFFIKYYSKVLSFL